MKIQVLHTIFFIMALVPALSHARTRAEVCAGTTPERCETLMARLTDSQNQDQTNIADQNQPRACSNLEGHAKDNCMKAVKRQCQNLAGDQLTSCYTKAEASATGTQPTEPKVAEQKQPVATPAAARQPEVTVASRDTRPYSVRSAEPLGTTIRQGSAPTAKANASRCPERNGQSCTGGSNAVETVQITRTRIN